MLSLGGALVVRTAPGASLDGFPLPERIFTKLPLLSNTIPVRYSLYVSLFAGLVLALALDRLHQRVARRSGPAWLRTPAGSALVPGLVALACLVPLIPTIPLEGFGDPGIPAYFTLTGPPAGAPDSVALIYPYPSSPTPQGQLWQAQADLRFKMPGGYFLVPQPPGRTIAFSPTLGYDTDTLTARTLIALAAGIPPARDARRCAPRCEPSSGRGTCRPCWRRPRAWSGPPSRSSSSRGWPVGPPTPEGGLLVWEHLLG